MSTIRVDDIYQLVGRQSDVNEILAAPGTDYKS